MAVISVLRKNGKNITKVKQGILKNITVNSVNYHFAKKNEVENGICDNSVNEPIRDMQIKGNSIQNETPTPEIPIEVESVRIKTDNILPFTYGNKSTTANGGTLTVNEDSSITASGTPTGYIGINVYSGKLLKGTTNKITLSIYGDAINTNLIANLIDDNQNNINSFTARINEPITIDYDLYPTAIKMDIAYRRSGNNKEMSGTAYIMINDGDKALPYEPPEKYKIPLKITHSIYDFDSEKIKEVPYTIETTRSGFDLGVLSAGDYVFDWELFDNNVFPNYLYLRHKLADGSMSPAEYITTEKIFTPLKFTADGKSHYYISFADSNITIEKAKKSWLNVKNAYLQKGSELNNSITNIYINEPLRKIGNYADYLDYKNKKVIRTTKEFVCNGTEDWRILNAGNLRAYYYLILGNVDYIVAHNGFNTHFQRLTISSSNSNVGYNATTSSTYNDSRILIRPKSDMTAYTDTTEWVQFLTEQYNNGTPMKMYYVLKTPTEETIVIPEISTFDGTTKISVEAEVEPSEFTVNYWKQIGVVEPEILPDEITQDGSSILIVNTGATITQQDNILVIGE